MCQVTQGNAFENNTFFNPASKNSVVDSTIFQLNPTPGVLTCAGNFIPQSMQNTGISVGMFDGAVRQVAGTVSTTTWAAAVAPNEGIPLGSDW